MATSHGCRAVLFASPACAVGLGTAVVRVAFGLTLALTHGIHKLPPPEMLVAGVTKMGFPLPGVFAWAASLAEFAGGLLLALGLFTRPAAAFIVFTMSVAFFVHHAADPFGVREMAFLYGIVALGFLFAGSGGLGVDALFVRKSSCACAAPREDAARSL